MLAMAELERWPPKFSPQMETTKLLERIGYRLLDTAILALKMLLGESLKLVEPKLPKNPEP